MLKQLGAIGVLVLVAGMMPGQPKQTSGSERNEAKNGQPAVISPHSQNEQPYAQANQPQSSSNPRAGNTTLERSHWWSDPNWWLVIVAGITGGFICWQSWETHESAEATRKSVELSANANTQWVRLKLLDMYSESERNVAKPPPEITLNCRWIILNPSSQPLTLHWVKVGVARDDTWHVCEFRFEEVISPGEEDKIVIVPISLGVEDTAEYMKSGVEHSVSFGVKFTGVNGKPSYQGWGDLFFFHKGKVKWNASLGKRPQSEYDEKYEDEGTIVPSDREIYEFRRAKQNPN